MIQISSKETPALAMSSSVKPTVYVVDDDADVLGSLRFLLETDGFNVRTFRNGAALLNAVRSTGVDCFVIDYKMPDMNGIDLAGRLRNRDIAAPVILITGYPGRKHLGEGRSGRRPACPAEAACSMRAWSPVSGGPFRKAAPVGG